MRFSPFENMFPCNETSPIDAPQTSAASANWADNADFGFAVHRPDVNGTEIDPCPQSAAQMDWQTGQGEAALR
jgi:hypothetical protein